jgi:DNA replicative helicase MCM subunit Mcm2 (Cdc46/Mcm family)
MLRLRGVKMFDRMLRRKREAPILVDVFLDSLTYDRFRAYVAKSHLDEGTALVDVLERGVANYLLMQFKRMKQDYPRIEMLFNEYKKDNEVLRALEQQNDQLQKILEEEGKIKRKLDSAPFMKSSSKNYVVKKHEI